LLSSESIIEPFTGTLVVFQPMEIRTFWNGWLTWSRDMSVSLDLPKSELYAELASQLRASWPIDRPIANMTNCAALIFNSLPQLNWAGFYLLKDGELVLGGSD
jgi:putative methionine-R-sulfoxide reductase with GAF domain